MICSWAGNLERVRSVMLHTLSLNGYLPCYSFDSWHLPRIEDTERPGQLWQASIFNATHLYEMPLYVVPTSKARIILRRVPSYAARDDMVVRERVACLPELSLSLLTGLERLSVPFSGQLPNDTHFGWLHIVGSTPVPATNTIAACKWFKI